MIYHSDNVEISAEVSPHAIEFLADPSRSKRHAVPAIWVQQEDAALFETLGLLRPDGSLTELGDAAARLVRKPIGTVRFSELSGHGSRQLELFIGKDLSIVFATAPLLAPTSEIISGSRYFNLTGKEHALIIVANWLGISPRPETDFPDISLPITTMLERLRSPHTDLPPDIPKAVANEQWLGWHFSMTGGDPEGEVVLDTGASGWWLTQRSGSTLNAKNVDSLALFDALHQVWRSFF